MTVTLLVLLILGTTWSQCKVTQNLGGEWTVSGTPKQEGIDRIRARATVPGGIYSDLMDNGIIGDILYGFGDEDYKWVSLSDWTYSTTFKVNESMMELDNIHIVFEGLDTFATVVLNDETIGQAQNMFVRYIFDVKDVLKAGDNSLHVIFQSAVNAAADLAELQKLTYNVPPNCPAPEYRGACNANQVRKMQASFSWDWGPSFPSVGIWKEVHLEAYNTAVIRYLVSYALEIPGENTWSLSVCTWLSDELSTQAPSTITINLNLGQDVLEEVHEIPQQKDAFGEIVDHRYINVSMDDVENWMPNGYGNPRLYDLTVTFQAGEESDSRKIRIGFRRVEIVQEKIDRGLSFYFRVNGVPIYAKGSNQIPLSILPEKGQDPQAVRRLLESAKDANMNMLRVWGGGVYESDYFYDTADELGLLIWQDFMFACAMYPSRPDFLRIVLDEIRHQMKRLYRHPSIATFAGNNENEAALIQNWYGTSNNFETYKSDYIKLYVDTIGNEVHRYVATANYIVSSPSNGLESEDEGYLARNPSDVRYGDVHFYNYAGNPFDHLLYPVSRFTSEYGYQSMPSIDTWLTATSNLSDIVPSSKFVDHRQHHPNGLQENTLLIMSQLDLPNEKSEYYAATYIYYSQIIQATSIKIETEHYRSFAKRLSGPNYTGYNMGALYWQLNDVWVAPTWSGIDYTGRWKMLHYNARQFFSPILITALTDREGGLEVYVVSDSKPLEAVALVHIFGWHTVGEHIFEYRYPIKLEAGVSTLVTTVDIEAALAEHCGGTVEEASAKCFFHFNVQNDEGINIAPTNFWLPKKLKDSGIWNASVEIASVEATDNDDVFNVSVTTDAIALFVWLDSHEVDGIFSDNGFFMHLTKFDLTFTAREPTTVDKLKEVLTVTHLKDPIHLV